MSKIREAFAKIEAYYKANNARDLEALNPPATMKDIQVLEKKLPSPHRLPISYVEWLKMHNGADSYRVKPVANFEFGPWEPMSITEVIDAWETLNGDLEDEPGYKGVGDKGVKSVWWNPKWIPIFANPSGDYLVIDLDPAPGGKIGQIVHYWHDYDGRKVFAVDFEECFVNLVDYHIDQTEKHKEQREKEKTTGGTKSRLPAWLSWMT
jgi:cell wall assembly regulator SMI1